MTSILFPHQPNPSAPPPTHKIAHAVSCSSSSPSSATPNPKPTKSFLPTQLTTLTKTNGVLSSKHLPINPHHSPTLHHYSSLIQSCIDSGSFDLGKSIHDRIVAEGIRPDPFLETKILMLYAREGGASSLLSARDLFDGMTERNLTGWNTMILAYAQADDHEEVINLFYGMLWSGFCPNKFTFPSVVKAFMALEHGDGVQQIHGLIVKTGLNHNVVVGSTLVDGYGAFGAVDAAACAFEEIDGGNVVTWNALIGAYERSLRWDEAWTAFYKMIQGSSANPNHLTLAAAIRSCGALGYLDQGKQVHAKVICHGYREDTFVVNTLIDMYAKCGDGENCLRVFDTMKERTQVSWNSIISALVHLGRFEDALVFFSKMQESGYSSDRFNLGSILMACAGLADVESGRELHGYLVRRLLDSGIVLGSALVEMYSKCGCMEMAHWAFNRLHERNEVCWNSLISGYVQEGMTEEALQVYHSMMSAGATVDPYTLASLLSLSANKGNADHGKQIHAQIVRTVGKPNLVLETELVGMYAKCGRLSDAWKFFGRMTEKNGYTWNALIEGLVLNDQAEEAFKLFYEMQIAGIPPDCFALASCLSASKSLSDQRKGKEMHAFLIKNMLEEHRILRCMLIDMYAKCWNLGYALATFKKASRKDVILFNVMVTAFLSCGRIVHAREIFDHMEERSTITWNSLLIAYAKGGFKNEAFKLFRNMLETDAEFDCATLVPILNLCASLPALEQGKQLHAFSIKKGFPHRSVVMDSALVDMYAKAGSIEEARRYFDSMKERNVVTWNTMITGYAKHGNSREVLVLYEKMQKEKINPNDVTFLSVLSACSHTGLVDEGLAVFNSLLEEDAIKAREEHYACIVDLLGRAGHLNEAKEMIDRMPIDPDVSTWGALLGACRIHKNVALGRFAAEKLFKLDPGNSGHYILMSNIYAELGRWKEAEEVRAMMRTQGVVRKSGSSWIEIDNEFQVFCAGNQKNSN